MMFLAIVLAVWVPALVVGAVWLWSRHRPLRYADRVLVNLTTGNAIEGVLVRNRGGTLTLAEAAVHTPEGEAPVDLEGRTIIPAERVDFMQEIGNKP